MAYHNNRQSKHRNPNSHMQQEQLYNNKPPQIPRLNISQVQDSSGSEQLQPLPQLLINSGVVQNQQVQNQQTSPRSSSAAEYLSSGKSERHGGKENVVKRRKRAEGRGMEKKDGEAKSNDQQPVESCIARLKKMDKKQALQDAMEFLSFTSKRSRFFLQCVFLVALAPTVVFHTQLRVQFDLWQRDFKEQNPNSDVVFDDEKDIINLSLIYTVISFFVLISSTVATELESKLLSKTLPPLANQFALSALLPFKGLQMPTYPLQTGNLLLFTVLTLLNVLFLSRKTWIKITCFAITMIYLVIAAIYRSHRMQTSIVFASMYDKESISMLVIDSMPTWYAVHQTLHLVFAFLIISLTARRLTQEQKIKNQIVKTKLDQLYECMGLEQSPYVVSRVIDLGRGGDAAQVSSNVQSRSSSKAPSYSTKQQNEIGYIITYISEGFKSLILEQLDCMLEDLVFRKIEVEKLKVFDEFGSSDDESATLLRKKTFSVAEKYLDCWMGKHIQVSNFKQLIDLENNQIGPIVQIYEVKSKQQLRLEKQKILDAKKKALDQKLGIQPLNGIDGPSGEQADLIGRSSERQEQPLLIHDHRQSENSDKSAGHQASSSAYSSTNNYTQSLLEKLFDQFERSYVKVKIKDVHKNGQVYRIVTCKKIQPSEQMEGQGNVKKNNPAEQNNDQNNNRLLLKDDQITEQEQESDGYEEDDMENLSRSHNVKKLNEMNKLQKLVQKLLPEQLNQLSMIQHCAENICFTLQRIFAADKAGGNFSKLQIQSLRHKTFENHVAKQSSNLVPQIEGTKKIVVSGAIQSSMRFSNNCVNNVQNNHPLLPEIQEFASNVLSSAQMLFQTFDTAIMCQKLLQSQLSLDCYQQQGGPKRIVRDVAKIVSPILIEKQLQVKINCSIDESQELKYIWRTYKSIIYHALLWSFNHSQSKQKVFVDIGLEWAIEGQHCQEQQMQAGGLLCQQSSSKQNQDDDSIELHKQRFLRTDIFFQGDKEYICQKDYQKAIRRDFTYKLAKILCRSVFGKLFNIIDEHFGVVHIILPIEEEVFDFIDGQKVDTHRIDWNQHNKKLFAVLRRKLYKDLKVAKGNDFTVQSTQNRESSGHYLSSSVKYATNSFMNNDLVIAPEVNSGPQKNSSSLHGTHPGNLFDQPIIQRNSLSLKVKSMNSSSLKNRHGNLAEEEMKYQKEPLLSDRNKSNVMKMEDKDNEDKSSDQSFKLSELSLKNEVSRQKLNADKSKEDKVRQAMQKDKLDMQKQIMDSIMQDEMDDDDQQSNSFSRKKNNQPNAGGAKGFRKPAMNQMFDKSESIKAAKKDQNNKPGLLVYRRLKTIREQEEQSEQAESRCVMSSASSAQSQQPMSNRDKSPKQQQQRVPVMQEPRIDYLQVPGSNEARSEEQKEQEDDYLVTVSSYQMSVDCDDEHIGEAVHNMHDKYYRLLRPEAFVNPLAADKNSGEAGKEEKLKNDQNQKEQQNLLQPCDNESAGDKEVINEGDAKPNASSRRQKYSNRNFSKSSEAQNPKLQLLEPPQSMQQAYKLPSESGQNLMKSSLEQLKEKKQSMLINDTDNNLDESLSPVLLPPKNKLLSIVEERNESENAVGVGQVYKSLASSNKNLGDQSMSSQSAEDSISSNHSVKCDCEDSCLIIDDICYNIIPTKILIKQLLNINVESCNNGFQGVQKYKADLSKKCCKRYIHFIIMDLQMPVMDGMAASQKINDFHAQMLQSDAELPPPQIIAITSNKLNDSSALAQANGIKEILFKPLNGQLLKECLKRYLDPELISRLQN